MKPLVLLRPEPGLRTSAARARALGLTVIECPLFDVIPVEWSAPPAERFDALLLTSANVVRHAGAALHGYRQLPVLAVGEETATGARDAGFTVERAGEAGVTSLLATVPAEWRLLHLSGRHTREAGRAMTVIPVYASVERRDAALPTLAETVVAVHSPRAGRRLAELAIDRQRTAIAAISADAARACGSGWRSVDASLAPRDSSLLALAARLCQG